MGWCFGISPSSSSVRAHSLGISVEEQQNHSDGRLLQQEENEMTERLYSTYTQQEPREFADEEGTYTEQVPVLRCSLCEEEIEDDYDHSGCAETVFCGAVEQLTAGGITFYQRRVMDGCQLWENDTLLLLAQGGLRDFADQVAAICLREGVGWNFEFTFMEDGPFDGSGRIWTRSVETARVVAEALQDLAVQLDAGKFEAEASWT